MISFSSDRLPAATRVSDWNTLYAQQLNRADFAPADRQAFAAELSLGRLGAVQVARMSANRNLIERTRRHILAGAPRLYSFLLQARGASSFEHCGHRAQLTEGDFVLCDSAMPHSLTISDTSTLIMLRVDARLMRAHLPTPERYCGMRLARGIAITDSLSATVAALNGQIERGFSSDYGSRFVRHLLDVLSISYAIGFDSDEPERSATARSRRADVMRYIEEHLQDPTLSPAHVAAGLQISARYMRTVFASSGETVSGYIMRRRLEQCAEQIRDPALSGQTLTQIAFSWGFNSAAHFTRAFSEHFGMPPRQYRREHAR